MNMDLLMNDPQIIAAIIQGIGTVTASLIAALAAAIIGRKFLNQERLRSNFHTALADIEFLLAVEAEHCEIHKDIDGQSNKNNIRKKVSSTGLEWSGKFTPERAKSYKQD